MADSTSSLATPAPLTSALHGMVVLDLSQGVAGQFAGRILAEHGADVLLVEPPGGTATRHPRRPEDRHLFWHLNTAKRSLVLDRATPAGRARFARLAARADVVLTDSGEDLAPLSVSHAGLVACTIREFTPGGPYQDWKGSEMIHQALSGLMFTTGRADRQPLYGFGYRAYYATGAAAVSAIVGALLLRLSTGRGQALSVSVHETAVGMSQNPVAQYSYNGTGMTRGPYPGACDMFECSDGWVSMFCKGDRWKAFCAALGHPEMPEDPRFTAINVVVRNWAAAYAILAPTVRQLSSDAFIARLTGARCLASKVNTMADVLACEHEHARGFWETVADDTGRARTTLGPVFRMGGTPRRILRGAPPLGPVGAEQPGEAPMADAAASSSSTSSTPRALPLAGKRVLEITTAWAGPMLGRILRHFGAEVVKLETLSNVDNWRGAVTGDDPARYPGGDKGARPWNRSAWFNNQNLGKLSLGLDAKSPAARPAVEALVKTCDIVISNFAAGALTRLKLDYPHLQALRHDIILLELNVTGEGGPLWDTRGVGPTMEALAGMTPLTGYGDGVPIRTGPAYVDPIGAMNGAMAVLLAVFHHARTGEGQRIEMAQREALMHLYGEHILRYAEDGETFRPAGNRSAHAAPHDAFRARGAEGPGDAQGDAWVAIAVADDAQWRALCALMGQPALATDPRFAQTADRVRNADLLFPLVEAWTSERDKHETAMLLQAHGIAAAPVSSGKDIFHDPQLRATGFLYQVDHPDAGLHWYHGMPFRFAGADGAPPPAAPLLGQHTDAILRGMAGLDDAAIARLHADNVAHQATFLSSEAPPKAP